MQLDMNEIFWYSLRHSVQHTSPNCDFAPSIYQASAWESSADFSQKAAYVQLKKKKKKNEGKEMDLLQLKTDFFN